MKDEKHNSLCGGEQYVNVFQSKMELDKKSNNICDTQQGEKGENAFQTFLSDFQVVVAVLGSYFPKDHTKKYRKQHHICHKDD